MSHLVRSVVGPGDAEGFHVASQRDLESQEKKIARFEEEIQTLKAKLETDEKMSENMRQNIQNDIRRLEAAISQTKPSGGCTIS